MSSEAKIILRDRLRQNYEAYIAGLQSKSASELIDLASEITAAKQVCEELPDACEEDAAAFLLQSDNPLEAVLGSWESELTGYDHSEEMRHMLWNLRDKEPYAVELHMEEKTERKGCAMQQITTEDLRKMESREGLILQACGGELQEWVDGINDLLTEAGILLNSSVFEAEDVSTFQHDGVTCLLFPFEGVELDMGRLAMWRLQTHGQFGGTWLSDYVPNRLGGFLQDQVPQKPKMELVGQDGNIFGIMGRASRLLKRAGQHEQADEMISRVTACGSYNEALNIISEYVETELSPKPEPQKSTKKKARNTHER